MAVACISWYLSSFVMVFMTDRVRKKSEQLSELERISSETTERGQLPKLMELECFFAERLSRR